MDIHSPERRRTLFFLKDIHDFRFTCHELHRFRENLQFWMIISALFGVNIPVLVTLAALLLAGGFEVTQGFSGCIPVRGSLFFRIEATNLQDFRPINWRRGVELGMHKHGHPKNVSIGTRILAFLWDYVLLLGYIALLIGLSFLIRPLLDPLFSTNPLLAEATGFLFLTLPVLLYFSICEGSKSHATWGKRKMGLVVARLDGKSVGFRTSLVRSALKFVPWELAHFTVWHMVMPSGYPDAVLNALLAAVYALVLLYLLSPLFNKNKQTVYDWIAGTVVRHKD